jgi:alpha-beta hydrolase superfamily lysophospholipase
MTLVSIPANPVPEDVVTGTIKTPDGAELRFARWAPPSGRKGTVCVFTGRTEQIEKYFETVRDLRDRGFAVAMIDWRGQGHSSRRLRDPRKGYVREFSDYEIDVETFVQQVVLPDCPPPHFALAHSMGGAVMLRVAPGGAGRPLHTWRHRRAHWHPILYQQSFDQRSRALRAQRSHPGRGSHIGPCLPDRGVGRYRDPSNARLSRVRLSRPDSSAHPDARRQQ